MLFEILSYFHFKIGNFTLEPKLSKFHLDCINAFSLCRTYVRQKQHMYVRRPLNGTLLLMLYFGLYNYFFLLKSVNNIYNDFQLRVSEQENCS